MSALADGRLPPEAIEEYRRMLPLYEDFHQKKQLVGRSLRSGLTHHHHHHHHSLTHSLIWLYLNSTLLNSTQLSLCLISYSSYAPGY